MLGGGSNIHRIQFLEDPTLRGGFAAWRRTQLEEEGSVSEDPTLRRSSSWEGLALRGSNLEEDLAPGGGSSTQRRIWCSEDPVLGGSSS